MTRALLATSVLAFAQCGSSLLAQDPEPGRNRPNILFIAVDDLRTSLGCYGDPLAKSPNIDQFAKTARRFTRAYVQQAVCGPSRTALLTGLLPDHSRVWHNRHRFRETRPNDVTLPQLFKQNGYRTISLGKVFSGNAKELDPISWSSPEILRQEGWNNYLLSRNEGERKKQGAFEAADVADDAYPDGKLANLAVETLQQLKQDGQPFFLAVGFFKPHLPFNAPRKYWHLHDPSDFHLRASLRQPIEGAPKLAFHTHRELGGYQGMPQDEHLNERQSRTLRHGYYACVSYVDAQIGKLLAALRLLQLDRNTTVVLWGDHGFALGEASRWCKGTNFEIDTRVPLMIRTPNLSEPGVATDSLVEVVDLYPTLAAVAELEAPDGLDGRSIVPILDDPQTPGRDAVLSQYNRPWKSTTPEVMGYSIRTAKYRYTRWITWSRRTVGAEELYDYTSVKSAKYEPTEFVERRNLVHDPAQSANLQDLRQLMDRVLARR